MKTLKRYWFRFEPSERPNALNLGCGVTAYDYDDATTVLREKVFSKENLIIKDFEEDVDLSQLDQRHVAPNIGDVTLRGIWFPLGN